MNRVRPGKPPPSEGSPEIPDDQDDDDQQDHERTGVSPLLRIDPVPLTTTPNAYERHGPLSVVQWPVRVAALGVHPRLLPAAAPARR